MEGDFAQTQLGQAKAPGMAPGRLACHSAVHIGKLGLQGETPRKAMTHLLENLSELQWHAILQYTLQVRFAR